MIEKYFTHLTVTLDRVKPLGIRSHFPKRVVSCIETGVLSNSGYRPCTPPGFPADEPEEHGHRSIRQVTEASYLDMQLRLGRITLHAREKEWAAPIEALAISYVGNIEAVAVGDSAARLQFATEITLVTLLANGAVASYYQTLSGPEMEQVAVWHPPGREGYGVLPHPKSIETLKELLVHPLQIHGASPENKAFQALPHLVMLAAETHQKVS